MALTDSYVLVYGQLAEFFNRIADGQAPEKFTRQYLKDLGFRSSNFHAAIPLLKSLGFLAPDGTPTTRYHEYRNSANSRRVMGEALKETYSDLFTIKKNPTDVDRPLIEGKFKSSHNTSPNLAKLMASTFYSLLELADLTETSKNSTTKTSEQVKTEKREEKNVTEIPINTGGKQTLASNTSLHYNIQIHLPATKDVEVFNAIFKSLKEHLID